MEINLPYPVDAATHFALTRGHKRTGTRAQVWSTRSIGTQSDWSRKTRRDGTAVSGAHCRRRAKGGRTIRGCPGPPASDGQQLTSCLHPWSEFSKSHLQKRFGIVDGGPTSYSLGIEVVRDMDERPLELHQQKYIRKVLLKFSQYMPKSTWNGKEFTFMHFTPTAHPTSFQNMPHVDEPVTMEDKKMMGELPYASVIGYLEYLNPCTRYVLSKLSQC